MASEYRALYDIADAIDDDIVYFRCEPPITDFTKPFTGMFIFLSEKRSISYTADEIKLNSRGLTFYNFLSYGLFNKSRVTFTWDIKQLVSYFKFHFKIDLVIPDSRTYDLKYCSSYIGKKIVSAPKSYMEALKTAKAFIFNDKCNKINRQIYVPLSFGVLPTVENKYVIIKNKSLYSNYEIEGTVNGRLSTTKPSNDFIVVHSLKPEEKMQLRSHHTYKDKDTDDMFILFDFKNMEAAFLQWLTKDKALSYALAGNLFYESLVDKKYNNLDRRKVGKGIFLPVIFGATSKTISEKLKLEIEVVDDVISYLKYQFSDTFKWLEEKQNDLAANSIAIDVLGRERDFTNEPSYKRRNFEVQAPSAMFCLEKLIQLYKLLPENILFHIHDGYVLISPLAKCKDIIHIASEILKSESELFEGLTMDVTCHIGKSLDNLSVINL